ncbi:MAG TPA: hypothetical protein VFV43_11970, partial [Limnobacter sp.]|nr:hypothetical protein [Limnobacter sp.]
AQDVAQAESLQQPPGRCTYCLTFNGHQDGCTHAVKTVHTHPAPAVAHGPGYKACCTEWLDKTEWVQERGEWPFPALGMHRADVIKKYIEHLESQTQAAAVNEQMLQLLKWVDKFIICAIGESVKAAIAAAEAAKKGGV